MPAAIGTAMAMRWLEIDPLVRSFMRTNLVGPCESGFSLTLQRR
jgi:hypothetical protein